MLAVTNNFLSTPREGSLVLTPNFASPGNPLKQYRWKLSKEGAEGQAFLISSANKRKFSRGQRESRTRKETSRELRAVGEEQSGWSQEPCSSFWDCLQSRERKGTEGNCPSFWEQFPASLGQGSP